MSNIVVVVCTLTLVATLISGGMTMSQTAVTVSKFSGEINAFCDVMDRVDRGCSVIVPFTRGRLDCFSRCGSDKSCIGASVDPQSSECFHHKECPILSGCSVAFTHFRHMTKHCRHGFWDDSTSACVCVDGAFGERCDRYHTKCKDLVAAGYSPGHHRVYIDPDNNGDKPFLAVCSVSLDILSTSVILFENHGVEDFNKTWNEYVNGFHYDWRSHWIGLYPLYRLSNTGSVDVTFHLTFKSRQSTFVGRTYFKFRVSDEKAGYSFTFDSTSDSHGEGDLPQGAHFGDCLGGLTNAPFSTWDADNDGATEENCAAIAGSGWWYKGCDNPCNVLGFGMQFKDSVSAHQLMSLMGVQLDSIRPPEQFIVHAFIDETQICDTNLGIEARVISPTC